MNIKISLSKIRIKLFRNHVPPISSRPALDPATAPHRQAKSKTWETTVTRMPSWPEEARPLKKNNWIAYLYVIGDLLLVLLPLYFILLGVAVITLNGKPTKENTFGPKVESAIELGPTIFPIVFAAIIGRSMKIIARYLAERGTKLSTLELLMASQSVWGTVESQLLMQRLTLVGVNLLFLWTLSPLGGQASLRLMTRENRETYSTTKLRYLTTGPAGTMWGLGTTYSGNGKFADAGALYSAALMAPETIKNGPRDTWGNVKIPSLELTESIADEGGWVSVPSSMTAPEIYSSLVGLPIAGLPSAASSNFSLESSYLSVTCEPFDQKPYPGANNDTNKGTTNWNKLEEIAPGYVWKNKTADNPFSPGNRNTSFFIDTDMETVWSGNEADYETLLGRLDGYFGNVNQSRLDDNDLRTRRELLYVSIYATTPDRGLFGLNIAKCSLTQKHVEAWVRCQKDQCRAEKVRKSLLDNRPENFTGFEHGVIMSAFATEFPSAVYTFRGSSPTERFLSNSSAFPFVQQVGILNEDVAWVNLSLVSADIFSKRLSLVLNTFYQLSTQPTGYFGGLPANLSRYGPDTIPATDINVYLPKNMSATEHSFFDWWPEFSAVTTDIDAPFIGATTTANVTDSEEVFVFNMAWLALLFTCGGIIFITGAVALVLKRITFGPEMFGFVASMTYENPFVKVPGGGTTLDAMERARLMRDVDVYVGDVAGDKDVGHIAFAAGVSLRKLERGRLYA